MHTLLCQFLQQIRPQRPITLKERHRAAQGQVLVIFGVSLLALLFFVGLAVDAGSLYVTYGQLKRAVDAAAVAAANDYKLHSESETMDQRLTSMTAAASEVLKLHNVDLSQVDLTVLTCTKYDSPTDPNEIAYENYLQTSYPAFYNKCPHSSTQTLRKLVYVSATQKAPLYFLSLLGFQWARLSTDSVAEAASVDLVLVFDISGSMAIDSYNNQIVPVYGNKYFNAYNPDETVQYPGCNTNGGCEPLTDAKNAAQALLTHLFTGYDQVAVVTFDSSAQIVWGLGQGGADNIQGASNAINGIGVHWDAPAKYMWPNWTSTPGGGDFAFNPVNPEDRDGDGSDADPALPAYNPSTCPADTHWDTSDGNPYGWGGLPCDDPGALDAYDSTAWAADYGGTGDVNTEQGYIDTTKTSLIDANGDTEEYWSLSPNSTCSGCGIRLASDILRSSGRSGSVWVMVYLSDGLVNLSDTAGSGGSGPGDTQSTMGGLPAAYPNGFCNGNPGLDSTSWLNDCSPTSWVSTGATRNPLDTSTIQRVCIDTSSTGGTPTADSYKTCPPTISDPPQTSDSDKYEYAPNTVDYNTLDYALDMTDTAALTKSLNPDEPRGNDMAIYTIGLGSDVGGDPGTPGYIGEQLLRYMAAVGDDGDRTTDPCTANNVATKHSCGNYYYAQGGANLMPIYEDIANRIYTRITE